MALRSVGLSLPLPRSQLADCGPFSAVGFMECLPSRASSSLLGSCQQAVGSARPMLRSGRHVARPAPGGSSRGSHCGGGAPSSPRHARLPALAAMVPNGYGGEPDAKAAQRRTIMMNYVSACSPNDVKTFVDTAPRPVVAAMRQTVANIVGALPSAYFEVKVSTMAESLSQLFLTMARTGYLFASAQCRMELQATLNSSGSDSNMGDAAAAAAVASSTSSLSPASSTASAVSSTLSSVIVRTQSSDSAPSSSSSSSSGDSERAGSMSLSRRDSGEASTSGRSVILLPGEEQYAPGVQKRNLEGEVLRWSYEKGVERLAAAEYVEHLEQQVATLKEMLLQVHEAHQQQQQQGGQAKLGLGSSGRSDGGAVRAAAAPAAAAAALQPPPPPPSLLSSVPSAATAAAAAAAAAATGSGELLEFLRGLPGDSLGELTSNMCPEVLDAMDAFVARLMGTSDKEQLRSMSSEFDGVELSKVLLWLLVVGYALRTAEMRLETLSFSGDAGQVPEGGLFGMTTTQQKKGPWDFGGWGKLLPGGK